MSEVFDNLRRGDGIVVSFGSKGKQYAIVYGNRNGNVSVVKWRAVSKTWTKRVKLYRADFIRRADCGEFKADPIPQIIWSGKA